MKERQYSTDQMWSLLTFIDFLMILPKEQQSEFQEKLNEIIVMEDHVFGPTYRKRLYELYRLFDRDGSTERMMKEKELENKKKIELQTKLNSALNLLKAGVSPKIVALSLNLPMEKVLEIQAQLNLGEA